MNSERNQNAKQEKASYSKPEVTQHGNVEKLTQNFSKGGCSSHPVEICLPNILK